MRTIPVLLTASLICALGCREAPECIETSRGDIIPDCSAGNVPVCGLDPDLLYDSRGALLPTPPASVESGSCDGFGDNCRPAPVCGAAGEAPTCANGEPPRCTPGRIRELMPPPDPPADAGTEETDAGTEETDAGTEETDAGTEETDAGTEETDAGTEETDAGTEETDAGRMGMGGGGGGG